MAKELKNDKKDALDAKVLSNIKDYRSGSLLRGRAINVSILVLKLTVGIGKVYDFKGNQRDEGFIPTD